MAGVGQDIVLSEVVIKPYQKHSFKTLLGLIQFFRLSSFDSHSNVKLSRQHFVSELNSTWDPSVGLECVVTDCNHKNVK